MPKRGKPFRKRKKGIRVGALFPSFFAVCLVASGVFLVFHLHSQTRSRIPYEEDKPALLPLEKNIKEIDRIIYKVFFEGGIPEHDVLFKAPAPRIGSGLEWDFTEIQVRLEKGKPVDGLRRRLLESLKDLGPLVSFSLEQPSRGVDVVDIFSGGFFTHKIRLSSEDRFGPYAQLPRVALIVDDLGYEREILKALFRFPVPLGFSALPQAPYDNEVIQMAATRGYELMLHLPMEPNNYPETNPGPGAILSTMDKEEIRTLVEGHVNSLPGVKGANNHMGSLLTTMPDKMAIVMEGLKKRGMFFVDSRTTAKTVAFDTARRMGVPTAHRSVFIDNELDIEAQTYQMKRLVGIARQKGSAIGIFHPHKEAVDFLSNYADRLKSFVKFVKVSELTK